MTELVSDPGFDDASAWSLTGNNISIANSVLSVAETAPYESREAWVVDPSRIVAGEEYIVKVDITGLDGLGSWSVYPYVGNRQPDAPYAVINYTHSSQEKAAILLAWREGVTVTAGDDGGGEVTGLVFFGSAGGFPLPSASTWGNANSFSVTPEVAVEDITPGGGGGEREKGKKGKSEGKGEENAYVIGADAFADLDRIERKELYRKVPLKKAKKKAAAVKPVPRIVSAPLSLLAPAIPMPRKIIQAPPAQQVEHPPYVRIADDDLAFILIVAELD